MNSTSTDQQVAVVTGAGRGIGRSVADGLARRGYRVAALARNVDAVSDLDPGNASVMPIRCDVTDDARVAAAVGRVIREWGRIDILFNNAGILRKGTLDLTPEEFDEQATTNLRAAWFVMRTVAPHMQQRGSGHIINLASRSGKFGFPNVGAYAATKFGLVGLNEALMKELAPQGIKVTAICPSWVNTDMAEQAGCGLPPEEIIQPDDIMRTIDWLLSLSPAACVQDVVLFCRNSVGDR
jgi:NAD(P)-dependent dehydrogenase (short-subunit alcohol dehydrogenase family)